jgi:hypothetical protein
LSFEFTKLLNNRSAIQQALIPTHPQSDLPLVVRRKSLLLISLSYNSKIILTFFSLMVGRSSFKNSNWKWKSKSFDFKWMHMLSGWLNLEYWQYDSLMVSFFLFFKIGSCYIVQTGLELTVFVPCLPSAEIIDVFHQAWLLTSYSYNFPHLPWNALSQYNGYAFSAIVVRFKFLFFLLLKLKEQLYNKFISKNKHFIRMIFCLFAYFWDKDSRYSSG